MAREPRKSVPRTDTQRPLGPEITILGIFDDSPDADAALFADLQERAAEQAKGEGK